MKIINGRSFKTLYKKGMLYNYDGQEYKIKIDTFNNNSVSV